MADRFPLIANTSANQIQELSASDNLDLTGNSIVGLSTIAVGSGVTITDGNGFFTGVITSTSFNGDGSGLTGVASTDNIRTNTNATFLQNVSVVGTSTVTGNIIPSSDSATDIGTSSVRFANIYGDTLYGDGSNLTGVGGGGMDFISRTYLSSTATYIDLTGFDYERVYKLIIKRAQWGGSSYQNLNVRFFINGASSPSTAGIYNYMIEHNGGHYTQNNDSQLNFYQYGGENEYITATFEIYTGSYGYLRGPMHHVGTTNGIRYADIRATLNPNVMTNQRISGVRLLSTNVSSWQVGSEVLLFRYKES